MLKLKWLNLQLFADGGDGGAPAGEAEGGSESGEEAIDARIPERARKLYKEVVGNAKPKQPEAQPTEQEADAKPAHVPYKDLIKSDDYKEEHKAYMEQTISDRLKRYQGIEEENASYKDILSVVANKYGLDPTSETFRDDLKSKVDSDDSYYEDYAMEHNISTEDAKEILALKQQAKTAETERQMAEQARRNQEMMDALRKDAERTKSEYPDFDLDAELANPDFRDAIVMKKGDTLKAYKAVHADELIEKASAQAKKTAQAKIAQSVSANLSRPVENGLNPSAAMVTEVDWSKASLDQIRAYAEEQRRRR